MKSLTEQQLRGLLREAWQDGGYTYWDKYANYSDNPSKPSEQNLKEREELFDKLISEC